MSFLLGSNDGTSDASWLLMFLHLQKPLTCPPLDAPVFHGGSATNVIGASPLSNPNPTSKQMALQPLLFHSSAFVHTQSAKGGHAQMLCPQGCNHKAIALTYPPAQTPGLAWAKSVSIGHEEFRTWKTDGILSEQHGWKLHS